MEEKETTQNGIDPSNRYKMYERLCKSFLRLREKGWIYQIIGWQVENLGGLKEALPLFSLRTPKKGGALWFVSGVHGDEIAGPIALGGSVHFLEKLGGEIPLVLVPFCNPGGFVLGRRYSTNGKSVGDFGHCFDPDTNPACREANLLSSHFKQLRKDYPPIFALDLHEDSGKIVTGPYLYFHSPEGDSLLDLIREKLLEMNIPLVDKGETAFGEKIEGGVVVYFTHTKEGKINPGDKSLDQFLAVQAGKPVVVFETPLGLPLSSRVAMQKKAIRAVAKVVSARIYYDCQL